jgi:hypothetical protein
MLSEQEQAALTAAQLWCEYYGSKFQIEILARFILAQRREAVRASIPESVRQTQLFCEEAVEATRPKVGKSAEDLARAFHETYERLAPQFDYQTRPDSAKYWDDVPENNRNLMIMVAAVIRPEIERKAKIEALEWALSENITLPSGLTFPDGARIASEIARLRAKDQEEDEHAAD